MMTLIEAIKHAENVASLCEEGASRCDLNDKVEAKIAENDSLCAEQHRQLASWLKELKIIHDEIDDMSDHDEIFIGYLRKKIKEANVA